MNAGPRDLSAAVAPEITEGRLARQWASVERRLPGIHARRFSPLRTAAWVVPVACLGLWLGVTQHERALWNGAVIGSSDAPITVQLRDGSSLELAARSQLRVLRDQPEGVKLEIVGGSVSFDVKHVERRAFEVVAGVVSVRVVGTQFQVVKAARREGMEVEVVVKRGVVEVQRSDRSGDVRRLAAGETWSVWVAAEPVPVLTPAPAPAPPAEPQAQPRRVRRHEPNSSATDAARGDTADAASSGPVKPGAGLSPANLESVRALFLRANVARRAGRMQDAALAYSELLRRFPTDSRAGVSAFELGRIRMDALGDPKGAAQAFTEALRSSHREGFQEDALARLAIAADATGDWDACRRARAHYLETYPDGVHVASLAVLCGDP